MKSMFGGQPDSVLVKMRNVLKDHINQAFPAQEIMDEFRNDPVRNYSFDDEYIKGMLRSEKGSNDAFYILRILYPDLDYSAGIHQDHMHPKSQFENRDELKNNIAKRWFSFPLTNDIPNKTRPGTNIKAEILHLTIARYTVRFL